MRINVCALQQGQQGSCIRLSKGAHASAGTILGSIVYCEFAATHDLAQHLLSACAGRGNVQVLPCDLAAKLRRRRDRDSRIPRQRLRSPATLLALMRIWRRMMNCMLLSSATSCDHCAGWHEGCVL